MKTQEVRRLIRAINAVSSCTLAIAAHELAPREVLEVEHVLVHLTQLQEHLEARIGVPAPSNTVSPIRPRKPLQPS